MNDDRAEMLPLEALLSERAEPEESGLAVLVFEAGGETHGIAAASVEAVVPLAPIAPLPSAPPRVVGVAAVRGRMRLVVDLGTGAEEATRLVVLHGDAQLALLAASVTGVVTYEPGAVDVDLVDVERIVEGE